MTKAKLAVVYHSGYGHTASQATAVQRGASLPGVETHLIAIGDKTVPWDLLEAMDAIVFGSPTYMGGQSAQFKAFQEATSRRSSPPVGGGRTSSPRVSPTRQRAPGDKLATLQQLAIFAAQHGMHWVALGLPPGNNASTGSENDLNRLGFFLGAAAQSNADEGLDVAPPAADLLTAEHLGRRVAEVALQFARGRLTQTAVPA